MTCLAINSSAFLAGICPPYPQRTSWLDPGSFTVASCASLYLSNAGAREGITSGPSDVRALISVQTVTLQLVLFCGDGSGMWSEEEFAERDNALRGGMSYRQQHQRA